MPDDITFRQLREKRLVSAYGPQPDQVLILIANKLARNELAGISQNVVSISAEFGDRFTNSGGFRKRASGYIQAILRYHSNQEAEAEAGAEAEAEANDPTCPKSSSPWLAVQLGSGLPCKWQR